ncbi:putative glycosyltransferase [Bacillus sp. TS-2]|nr:putative glycosyltransferase [Bacillus sp. TS-2]
MKKHLIRLHKNNHDGHLIFHATPTYPKINPYNLFEHHWYITEAKDTVGFPIEGECFEMYVTTTQLIKEKNYDGLYLYCKRIDKKTNAVNNTEFVKLYSDVNKILNCGTVFDDISVYDENGYVSANVTSQEKY